MRTTDIVRLRKPYRSGRLCDTRQSNYNIAFGNDLKRSYGTDSESHINDTENTPNLPDQFTDPC